MPEMLRADIADQMSGRVGVTVGVTVQTGNTRMRVLGPPIGCLVELLLRKALREQSQAVELLGSENAAEELEEISIGDKLPLRDIP